MEKLRLFGFKLFQGARLLKSIPFYAIIVTGLLLSACKKKEAPAVIEEVNAPQVSAEGSETDTSAMLKEEPALKALGEKAGHDGKSKKSKKEKGNTADIPKAADKAGLSENGRIAVQVSVFKSKKMAENLMAKLASAGYPAYVTEVESPTPELAGTYHRVRVGYFAKISEANTFGENVLKPMGYDFWVDNKSHDNTGGGEAQVSAPVEEKPKTHTRRKKKSSEAEPASPASDFSTTPSAPSEPSIPAAPASESWGSPASEPATPAASSAPESTTPAPSVPSEPTKALEPPAPANDSWGAPKSEPTAPDTGKSPGKDAW